MLPLIQTNSLFIFLKNMTLVMVLLKAQYLLMLPSSLTGIVFIDIYKNDDELIVLHVFVCPMFYLYSIVVDIATSQQTPWPLTGPLFGFLVPAFEFLGCGAVATLPWSLSVLGSPVVQCTGRVWPIGLVGLCACLFDAACHWVHLHFPDVNH